MASPPGNRQASMLDNYPQQEKLSLTENRTHERRKSVKVKEPRMSEVDTRSNLAKTGMSFFSQRKVRELNLSKGALLKKHAELMAR